MRGFLLRRGSSLYRYSDIRYDDTSRQSMQKGCLMAIAIQQISPVAHLPLVLGVVRKLNVAALIETFCPPHPAHVLSCGRGVEALLLAILDGHHALYKSVFKNFVARGELGVRSGDETPTTLPNRSHGSRMDVACTIRSPGQARRTTREVSQARNSEWYLLYRARRRCLAALTA